MKSRIGAFAGLAFLGLIALAFASADIAGTGGTGGLSGGDRVAKVGKQDIGAGELSRSASLALENLKQQNPRLSMQGFIAAGGLENVLDDMISRTALAEFGRRHGIIASDRLIDSEIAKMPAFLGPDGKFSETLFRQVMQQRGVSEAAVRSDLAQGLVARQLLLPATLGGTAPQEMASRYAALLRENRKGAIALLPSVAFVPRALPGDAQLAAWYKDNADQFIRPERRVIRFATFGGETLKDLPSPSEAEIQARYNANRASYAALERRKLAQLIVPTQAAAQAVLAEVSGGKSLEAAARAKGLATAAIGPVTRQELAGQASQAVAEAAFAAPRGAVAAPARAGLGWYVLRVDSIEVRPARSLDQVRGELAAAISADKRRTALSEMTARIEEEFDNGGNLAEAASDMGLTIQQTQPITADGMVYARPDESAPPVLAPVIQTAFSMEGENQPQIAEVEAGKTFIIFDVSDIAASAPAPLAEIKQDVQAAYLLEKGAEAAKAAAEKVQAAVRKGTPMARAVADLKVSLPPVQPVDMNRARLTAGGQQVPPPLMLLFSMAQGTVKTLSGERNQGWFVVALDKIDAQPVPANDPVVASARRELGRLSGDEYAQQLRGAIRAEAGVTRNKDAIRALRTQLGGSAN